MSRSSFNPNDAAGPPPDTGPARREGAKFAHAGAADELSVGQLSQLIKNTLEQRISAPIRVVGEMSNLHARKHWYFSLKDDEAVINCVAWVSTAARFTFRPNDGDRVVVTGHVSHYGPQGRTQFYVRAMEPAGLGDLELRFRELCAELRAAGYFEESTKLPLPGLPRRIAVITSAGSAAEHDVIANAAERWRAVSLLLVDTRVQGDGAAAMIARAIRHLDANHAALGIDAIVVTRGGGSIEDLWAFNERVVADAVHECSIPLVAAIGHESDTTVIELVADRRATTPTQATALLVPDRADLARQVEHLEGRLNLLVRRAIEQKRQRLALVERTEALRDPRAWIGRLRDGVGERERRLASATTRAAALTRARLERLAGRWAALARGGLDRRQQRLAVLADRLRRAAGRHVTHERERVDGLARRLEAIDPRRVLARGFSYTTLADGSVLRKAGDAPAGTRLVTHLGEGEVRSVVEGTRERANAKRNRAGDADAGPGLFGDAPAVSENANP